MTQPFSVSSDGNITLRLSSGKVTVWNFQVLWKRISAREKAVTSSSSLTASSSNNSSSLFPFSSSSSINTNIITNPIILSLDVKHDNALIRWFTVHETLQH